MGEIPRPGFSHLGDAIAPRDKTRPKAADLSDALALKAYLAFQNGVAPDPMTILSLAFPPKVVRAKVRKLRGKGFLDAKEKLTDAGLQILEGAA